MGDISEIIDEMTRQPNTVRQIGVGLGIEPKMNIACMSNLHQFLGKKGSGGC